MHKILIAGYNNAIFMDETAPKEEDMVITSHICRGNYYSTFSGSVSPCLRQNTIYKTRISK